MYIKVSLTFQCPPSALAALPPHLGQLEPVVFLKVFYFRNNRKISSDARNTEIYVQILLGDIITSPRGCQSGSSHPPFLKIKWKVPKFELWGFHTLVERCSVSINESRLHRFWQWVLCLKYIKITKMKAKELASIITQSIDHADTLSFVFPIITFKMTLEMRHPVSGRAIEGNEGKKGGGDKARWWGGILISSGSIHSLLLSLSVPISSSSFH